MTQAPDPATSVHLIADLAAACDLCDLVLVEDTLRAAAEAARVTVLDVKLHHFGPGCGVTGVAVLAESHMSIHTWPETAGVAVDIFVCGSRADPQAALRVICERLAATVQFSQAIPRMQRSGLLPAAAERLEQDDLAFRDLRVD